VREKLHEHVKQVSAKLPHFKRVKVVHLWDHELPRTATRKVKRKLVVEELMKLQRSARTAEAAAQAGPAEDWLVAVIAQVTGKPVSAIHAGTRLEELGFDSLMYTELGVALEAAGVVVGEDENLQGIGTVDDLAKLVGERKQRRRAVATILKKQRKERPEETDDLPVWPALARVGRELLTRGQKWTYEKLFETEVTGKNYLPQRAPFIVAANHASHLDMGLVKHALGDWGGHLRALAAKDYFFEDRLKRAYFENFTNLVPMDRHGSLRESLRLASQVLGEGNVLLIFPEGTRSESGVMADFKASIGYLALSNEVDVVPMYLGGTHDALPKGAAWPKQRKIAAHIGPVLTFARLRQQTEGMAKSDQYREAARLVEVSVRKLGGLPVPPRHRLAPPPETEAEA
jgi:long-chain acyl-CoA synthetase